MRTWLITGSSRGLGRALAEEVLARGEQVVLAARQPGDVADLADRFGRRALPLRLDVTDAGQCESAVEAALHAFGRVDVLVNNAGYGLLGAVEEVQEEEIRRQFETNFFGALALTRAFLPHFRAQKSGHILNISSHAGYWAWPGFGIYCASKFALEGLSESLAQELAPLGIHVVIVEPGPFRTEWVGPSLVRSARVIPDYEESSGRIRSFVGDFFGTQPGDPLAAARAMADIVELPQPPLRLVLGAAAVEEWRAKLAAVTLELDEWEGVARAADYDPDAPPPSGYAARRG
jgi:NAD(P)-dependent dehydrogenase (short-subunit alcohol dehydrogenase family)